MRYHAVTQKSGDWWIGWLSDLEGANAQERTIEELLESLRIAAVDLINIRGGKGDGVEVVLESVRHEKRQCPTAVL